MGPQVGVVEVRMVHGGRAQEEGGDAQREEHPYRGGRGPAGPPQAPRHEKPRAAEDDESERQAAQQTVRDPRIAEKADGQRHGPGRGQERGPEEGPPSAEVQEEDERDHDRGHDPRPAGEPHARPGTHRDPDPVELHPEVLALVRVRLDGEVDAGRGQRAHGGVPLDPHPAAALETVDGPAGEAHVDHGRLAEDARETHREVDGAAGDHHRQVHRRVIGRPVGGRPLVDLVLGGEPRHVRTVAGTEVQGQRERPARPRQRGPEGRQDHEGGEDEAARAGTAGRHHRRLSQRCGTSGRVPRGRTRCRRGRGPASSPRR